MKRVFFLITILLVATSVFCQQVTQQEAVKAAVNTMRYNGRTSMAESSVLSVNTKSRGDTILMYEVIFQSGELVLLSGNKSCLPVLGYCLPSSSSTPQSILNNYPDIPAGLRDMLGEYEEQIVYCFRNNLTSGYSQDWQKLQQFETGRAQTSEIVSPLLSTEWGQDKSNDSLDCNAYNYYITDTGNNCTCDIQKRCPTGCVATAMAQIMKYWNYPVFMPCKKEQYDWCNMPRLLMNTFNPNYMEERNAIARLMRDCGEAVNMVYCDGGCSSGAYISDVPDALRSFSYSDDVTHLTKFFNASNWLNLLKDDLDAGYPVLYGGVDLLDLSGHAFVCDGYRSDNTFHFNWGWNGQHNNIWCTLNQLNPNNHSFVSMQEAVFNIHPNLTDDYCDYQLPLDLHYHFYYDICGNTTPFPYENVPKTFTYLISASNNPQYPSSWRTIPNGATSEYVAHKTVLLRNDFYAEPGCNFYAHIVPCESCNEDRMMNDTADVAGVGSGDTFDTFTTPKSLETSDTGTHIGTLLRVYPNPTDDLLFVELSGGAGIANMALYDLQGRVVGTQFIASATVNMRDIPAGVYVLRVMDADGKEYHRKIVRK
jgi:hypothetical protein